MASPLEIIKSWEVGQLAAVVSKLGEENSKKILSCDTVTVEFADDRKEATVKAVAPVRSLLRIRANITLPARSNRFEPKKFFKTGSGLYVWDDFTSRVLSVAKPVDSLPEAMWANSELSHDATDAQIRAELPADHVFEDASVFCAYLAGMIERQSDGINGFLLSNGYTNIFYVQGKLGEVFAVYVSWHGGGRQWCVDAGALDGLQWFEGYRVFSRTLALSSLEERGSCVDDAFEEAFVVAFRFEAFYAVPARRGS